MIAFLIQVFFRPKADKVAFLITHVFQDNCLCMMDYLQQNTAMNCVLLTDAAIFEQYASQYSDVSRVKVFCKGHSIRALYEMLTSQFVFYMHMRPYRNIRRIRNQIVVNLWHGAGFKANDSERYLENEFDMVLVPGSAFVPTKAAFFGCSEKKVLPLGYPRYDLFFKEDPIAQKWKRSLLCQTGAEKIILWMPTYRISNIADVGKKEAAGIWDFELPLLDSQTDLENLDLVAKQQKICILIKRHPYQASYESREGKYQNIIFIEDKDLEKLNIKLYALLPFTDALITDYSSVSVDYLLLNKPIAYTLADYEEYRKSRGFVFPEVKKHMPGHHLYKSGDLCCFVQDVSKGKDPFKAFREGIMREMQNPCNGYCERIWRIAQQMRMPGM